ncbi:DUF3224 domain-containing protein [Streptomyces reniochalinae]|nr:DUF3224 domain-containing protein [Streptomyces reniochalinae]
MRCTFDVAPGSATAALTGLTGDGSYEVRHGQEKVAVTFSYTLG